MNEPEVYLQCEECGKKFEVTDCALYVDGRNHFIPESGIVAEAIEHFEKTKVGRLSNGMIYMPAYVQKKNGGLFLEPSAELYRKE